MSTHLEKAMNAMNKTSGDIIILFYFIFGLLVVLIIIWTLYKIVEEKNLKSLQREKVENYLEKGVLYDEPRQLGNGMVEYQIEPENCIFVQDEINHYVHSRYDVILVRSSDEDSNADDNDQ